MMIILCQWDFSEQIEKLLRMLLYTSENCSRKFNACTQSVNEVVIHNRAGVCLLLISILNTALLADMFLNQIEAPFSFNMASV